MRDAVVVGIDSYSSMPLGGCVQDAIEMSECLGLEQYGYENRVLLDENATRSKILEALMAFEILDEHEASEEYVKRDVLLFYFAGHGVVIGRGAYLVTVDGKLFDPGISLAELAQIMETASHRYDHVIAILDCCHSGGAFTWVGSRPIQIADIGRGIPSVNESRCLLAACRPEQGAIEENGHGLFTRTLVTGLLGDAVDFNGEVSLLSLHDYVSRALGENQTPVFKGDIAGTVVLGSGFEPRKGPPIAHDELAKTLSKAHHLLDEYSELQQREMSLRQHRLDEGARRCSANLESVRGWFRDTSVALPDISRNPEWINLEQRIIDSRRLLCDLTIGQKTQYGTVVEHLGHGGYGHVWRVQDDRSESLAYKVFHGNELDDRIKVMRFVNGYNRMELLDHPRIVKVHGKSETPYGFLMDYIPGDHLCEAYISREDPTDLLRLIIDVVETVNHAHGRGVLHRDIKPENIIIGVDQDAQAVPYLTDFDLAYHITNRSLTSSGSSIGGAMRYAAPEQLDERSSSMARRPTVDIFSLAQLMYFIFVQSPPQFMAEESNRSNFAEAVLRTFESQPANLLAELYKRTSERNPNKRVQATFDFLQYLYQVQNLVTASTEIRYIGPEDMCRMFGEMFTGGRAYSSSRDEISTASLSGQVAVILRIKGMRTVGGVDGVSVEVELSVTNRLPVPEFKSGSNARLKLNSRLDKIVSRYPGVTRHPGNRGAYQVFLHASVTCDSKGVAFLRDVVSAAVAGIEQW